MSKFVDCIIGHTIGNAMGIPTKFCHREYLLENPVKEMINSKITGKQAGSWSDEILMELAIIDSFIQNKYFDYKEYHYQVENLNNNQLNSNKSLMRMLPVALYSHYKKLNDCEIINLTNEISSLNNEHDINKLGCYIYVRYIMFLLDNQNKNEAYESIKKLDYSSYNNSTILKYHRILKDNILNYKIDDISSSSYVVDTLECVLWVFLNANSFKETIIATTNIGNDTDTIGALSGTMAGIIYGYDAIPKEWLDKLARKEYLIGLALDFEKSLVPLKKDVILGTIIGDVAGSRFEIVNNKKGKEFVLLDKKSRYTDDSVMTLAVAKSLINCKKDKSDIQTKTIDAMVELGKKYPDCGYGPSFYKWIMSKEHEPYRSFGNGAAMRISAVGMAIKDIEEIKKITSIITNVSHNHPDSIQGAQTVAIAIRMALDGKDKQSIKNYIENNYFKINDLKITTMKPQLFHINCVETVKQSLIAFLDSYDFEDAIRNAIALGGDSDTIGAITGSIASAYYGIPEYLCNDIMKYLDSYLIQIHDDFIKMF